jgi:hypothetical protein
MDRELRALFELLLDEATEREKAILRHRIEELLTELGQRAEKRAA